MSGYLSGDDRRDALYDYLVEYKTANGGATPTVREMARAVETAPSVVHFHLRVMAAERRIGLVRGSGRSVRHITIPGERWTLERP